MVKFFTEFNIDKTVVIAVMIGYFVIAPYFRILFFYPLDFNALVIFASGIFGLFFAFLLGRIAYLTNKKRND